MSQTPAPPFRADHVGSLLRPAALQEARRLYAAGVLEAADLAAVEDREIARVIAKQQELGLRGITDGELRREGLALPPENLLRLRRFFRQVKPIEPAFAECDR